MTTFIDGPAKGQTLQLRRAPVFLRVTEKDGEFDGLDQLDDRPKPGETLHAYRLTKKPGGMHILVHGKNRARGGFWPIAEYELVPEQPSQELMRQSFAWEAWTDNEAPRPAFLLE